MNQHQLNTAIEKFILDKDSRYEPYSQKDIAYIMQHEGKGGQGKHGAKGEGVLYQFFTPDYIVKLMWKLAIKHGYDGGYVLEPSCATGRLFEYAPNISKCVGFEIDPILGRISELSYPTASIYYKGGKTANPYFKERLAYFETAFMLPDRFTSRMPLKDFTWLDQYPFSLVIGNPPYGKHKNFYSSHFKRPKMNQIEVFFMYYGLLMLKPGGLLVYITGSNFLRNGNTYNSEKAEMSKIADLVDAYRLPSVFKFTEVPTDILVFKRK